MTNEEAITELHYILNHKVFGDARLVGAVKRAIQALEQIDEIIKALEQRPSEDTEVIKVSKGAVKARQGRFVIYDVFWLKENFYTEEKIYGQPKQPCEDCISRKQALVAIQQLYSCMPRVNIMDSKIKWARKYEQYLKCEQAIKELPSVKPERPKGKWITWKEAGNYIPSETRFECSVCHDAAQTLCNGLDLLSPYCPNCGAEMSGGGEDEDGKSL